jgi:hypothetical protein
LARNAGDVSSGIVLVPDADRAIIFRNTHVADVDVIAEDGKQHYQRQLGIGRLCLSSLKSQLRV